MAALRRPLLELPDLRRLTVVVFGDFVADEYLYGETERLSREAPVPIVRFERSELVLGAAANVARNLRALGVGVRAVGGLGRDAVGRRLRQACRRAGIEVAGLLPLEGVTTAVKTRVLAGAPHSKRQQLLRLDRGSGVDVRHGTQLAAALAQAVRGADGLVVSDYGLGSVGRWAPAVCARLARQLPVCVDSRFELAAFRGVTIAKPNGPEFAALVGSGAARRAPLARQARLVLARQKLGALLVTRGRDGLALFRPGAKALELPVFGPREAVDVTGAGDTVLAALAAVLAHAGDLPRAARLANIAAGLVVQKSGTAVVSAAELRAALRQEEKGGR